MKLVFQNIRGGDMNRGFKALFLFIFFLISGCKGIVKEKVVFSRSDYKEEIGVFKIDVYDYKLGSINSTGSAFASVYAKEENKTYLFTNNHICESAESQTSVLLLTGVVKKDFVGAGSVEYSDWKTEICIFSIIGKLKLVKIKEDGAIPFKNDRVTVIGAPLGMFPVTSIGTVIAPKYERYQAAPLPIDITVGFPFMYLNVEIQPGSSGSPVFNSKDEVIGMIFAGSQDGTALAISYIDLIAAKKLIHFL